MMEEILNFVQLTADVGTSGQPTVTQFKTIADAGYAAVVNLAMPDSESAIAEEGSIVTGLGMRYVHIPVPFDSPSIDDLRLFISTMNALQGERQGERQGGRVWVHCAMNLRVSAFMYHYLHHAKGLDRRTSRSPVFERWEPRMDAVWQNFMALTREDIEMES